MSRAARPASEPASITVGELISELCRWPDQASVRFRCPLQRQEFRFYRIESLTKDIVEVELARPGPGTHTRS